MEDKKRTPKSEIFKKIHSEVDSFFAKYNANKNLSLNAKLASLISIIRNNFSEYPLIFVGFYMVEKKEKSPNDNFKLNQNGEILEVGVYNSTIVATALIEYGKGVCGSAWEQKKTLIEKDVSTCDNYIACDDFTKSEIVVPLFDENNNCIGVLDIDSEELSAFDEEDKANYELLLKKII